ncbi:RHS repeat-associated core domain-containing protein [Pseudomonas sp. URIL14HWK12:I9]|uniref:RHS repeat-associated core domain-containing protein n=1 Tax=unclassified Pseudomonas TaxID=196821 RepID=UPI000BDB6CE0|nr:RHS repeat-associated protein [Pseudomonas sp. URIL14HWK12:I12]PVZ24098.1 RHS repeat-associated protein [Pseudomonas sp. URIL14HWK12:I10]PVZ33263.1 RHS repeat-associated protein [Pseudomonas sp. URIL14HWK12:I11]SNZ10917.1 RHS repeat-associated core domain-containing protein [Pseudomonas sp. URIL14HWK12:I9]
MTDFDKIQVVACDVSNTPIMDQQRNKLHFTAFGYSAEARTIRMGYMCMLPERRTRDYLAGSYRLYIPALMRFNKPDTLSPFWEGLMNAYTYCLDDPINNEDATGHLPTFIGKFFGKSKSYKPLQTLDVTKISKTANKTSRTLERLKAIDPSAAEGSRTVAHTEGLLKEFHAHFPKAPIARLTADDQFLISSSPYSATSKTQKMQLRALNSKLDRYLSKIRG